MLLTALLLAIRLKCDVVQTLGFLVASSFAIFAFSVVAGLALYGLSILLEGVEYHKTHCNDSKHWAGMLDFMR